MYSVKRKKKAERGKRDGKREWLWVEEEEKGVCENKWVKVEEIKKRQW